MRPDGLTYRSTAATLVGTPTKEVIIGPRTGTDSLVTVLYLDCYHDAPQWRKDELDSTFHDAEDYALARLADDPVADLHDAVHFARGAVVALDMFLDEWAAWFADPAADMSKQPSTVVDLDALWGGFVRTRQAVA